MLDDYDSGDEAHSAQSTSDNGISASTQALLTKLKGRPQEEEDDALVDETRIIFCSRTHSQLTQFVSELRRVKPPSSMTTDDSSTSTRGIVQESIKHISLGSRKNLCINPKVVSLSSTAAINERCVDLQKPGTSKEHKCPFLPTRDDRELVEHFRDLSLAKILDIEDLGKLGKAMGVCPYYAARSVVLSSEVLTLPYPLLLQKSAREALSVPIKGHIILIDEAHNLMDAIADTCSVTITLQQLDVANSQLTKYVQRFKSRLKGANRMYVTQVLRLLNSIADCLRQFRKSSKRQEVTLSTGQLMVGKGGDQIRPHKLIKYLTESKLAQKVEGYITSKRPPWEPGQPDQVERGALMHTYGFLFALMNPSNEGRFLLRLEDRDVSVRYTLLDPTEHFREIVDEARAVILVGGTMSPMSDYADYLFSYLPADRIKMFSFGHVIPQNNLLAQAVLRGPSGIEFDFTFDNRAHESMIAGLGQMVQKTCQSVPDGVVVFFPSYDYLSHVLKCWQTQVAGKSILSSLQELKGVFVESKATTSAEGLLREYAQMIDNNKGALLLSVVGGRLSEGINFSDRLGRAVLVVGMPFPNIHGAEWKAKVEHIEKTKYARLMTEVPKTTEQDRRGQAKAAGREFYENTCMRAVNQCIGRAIRHQNDYAAILLVDKRYSSERIRKKLPAWIRESMDDGHVSRPFSEVDLRLKEFFAAKR